MKRALLVLGGAWITNGAQPRWLDPDNDNARPWKPAAVRNFAEAENF